MNEIEELRERIAQLERSRIADISDVLIPLMIALHEKKVISLTELALAYEDALARRTIDRKDLNVSVLREFAAGIYRLSVHPQAR